MKLPLIALLLSLLAACSSTSQVNYYQLSQVVAEAATPDKDAAGLYIAPVQVASYLSGRSLVMQLSDVELVLTKQHLWAEPVELQIQRLLRDELALKTTKYSVLLQPTANALVVNIQIDRFHGLADGSALLSGRYSLSQHGHTDITKPFVIKQPLTDDGYSALVNALSLAVQQLCANIASQLPA